jgi:zinc transporter ZupT
MIELTSQVAIIFGLIVVVVHYFSDRIKEYKKYHKELLSFAAGISLTYLLLFLLPELYEGIKELQKFLFLFVLLGAVMFHVVEKYLYQHDKKKKLIADLSAVHAVSFFTYHFVIGVVTVNLLQQNYILGTLFFIPILTYTAVGQVSLKEIHAKVTEKKIVKLFLASSTLIGIIEAVFIQINAKVFYGLLGFVAGAMLYHVMRESIPSEKEGNALMFLLGAMIYTTLILLIWSI